ncbi:MAG: protoporphyrinogen oxidase, partial [Nitrospira sp. SB0678_bin_10]|nr:protoporphyrinogen oxidase [Nitrospira sp. SB0678_bin_10]
RGREHLLDLDDSELAGRACRELEAIAGIQSRPLHVEVYRWPRAMPQYIRGHRERVRRIRERVALQPGLFVTGAAYDGIGIPDCIRDADQTSAKLSAYLWGRAS